MEAYSPKLAGVHQTMPAKPTSYAEYRYTCGSLFFALSFATSDCGSDCRFRHPCEGRGDGFTLHPPPLFRSAAVVRNRSYVFDGLYRQTRLLQGGDGTFPTTAGSIDFDFDLPHTELHRLVGGLLGCHLTGKGGTFSAALEVAGSAGRPAEGIAFGVRNSNGRIVEGCLNVGDSCGNAPFDFAFFRCCRCFCHVR